MSRLDRDGFAIVRDAVNLPLREELRIVCEAAWDSPSVARRGDAIYGIRNLLATAPRVREIVSQSPFSDLAVAALGISARPVSGVFFDKPATANWPVPWHQDLTIRVCDRIEVAGFEPRPVKDGIVHMLPPIEISEQILALRIHLDDASSNHGALKVIPGSHRQGRLSNLEIDQRVATVAAVMCDVHAGDIMCMRPLIVHSSSACEQPGHRRVIHIEYAAFDLPGGLQWQGEFIAR